MDEILRTWGRNIASRRSVLNAVGELRSSGETPMTQFELGRLLDPPVAQSTVARWEKGDMEPRRHYKAQLAACLKTDAAMLFPLLASASLS